MFTGMIDHDPNVQIYADPTDLCYKCPHVSICPLLGAIFQEAVVLRYEHVAVESCGLHKFINPKDVKRNKFKEFLKIALRRFLDG